MKFSSPLVIVGILVIVIAAIVIYKKSKNGKPTGSLISTVPPYHTDLVNAPMEGTIANPPIGLGLPPLAGMAKSGCSKCSKGM